MAVHIFEIGRPVAGDLVEGSGRWIEIGGNAPAPTARPRSFRQGGKRRFDRSLEPGLIGYVSEADILCLRGTPDQMVVRILETWQHQRPLGQIVDLRPLEERRYIRIRSDSRDLTIHQRDGTGFRLGNVHRQNARPTQDDRLFGQGRNNQDRGRGAGQQCRSQFESHRRPPFLEQGTRRQGAVKAAQRSS